MGFFDSLKRNTEVIKAETDIPNIISRITSIREDFDNDFPVGRKNRTGHARLGH